MQIAIWCLGVLLVGAVVTIIILARNIRKHRPDDDYLNMVILYLVASARGGLDNFKVAAVLPGIDPHRVEKRLGYCADNGLLRATYNQRDGYNYDITTSGLERLGSHRARQRLHDVQSDLPYPPERPVI